METLLVVVEKALLLFGLASVLLSLFTYGKRSQDWKGVATVFYKRVNMTLSEFKCYKLGVSLLILAVVLRIVVLTIWP